MHEQVIAAIQLEKELRRAVKEAQFRVLYQPIFAADRRTPVGFEALVRWQHPKRGLLEPGAFLGVAEETGLIVEIDRLVWREACAQVRLWQQHFGRSLALNLNLSSQQFYHPDLLATLEAIFEETGIAPDQVNLELTEGALVDASPGTTGTLEALKALGCGLYLDDFGTGYSSLSYLQHFPIDVLKIDRSFVTRLNRDHDSTELVRTIVAMARNLKLKVVAEGVETQFTKLRELGCTYTQGFLFAEPLSGEDAAALVARLGRVEIG